MITYHETQIPRPDDFISTFGCTCSIDDYLVQTCQFQDQDGVCLELSFSLTDNAFTFHLMNEANQFLKFRGINVERVSLDEDNSEICIFSENNFQTQRIILKVWPKIVVNVENIEKY